MTFEGPLFWPLAPFMGFMMVSGLCLAKVILDDLIYLLIILNCLKNFKRNHISINYRFSLFNCSITIIFDFHFLF